MNTKKTAAHGFTIVELLSALVLTSFLIISIATFTSRSMASNNELQAKSDLLRKAQTVTDIVTKDIRLSANSEETNSIEDPNSPSDGASPGFGWESNSHTLILAKSAEDTDHNILFADANKYITEKDIIIYFTDNRNLYKRTLAANVLENRRKTSCPSQSSNSDCPKDVLVSDNVDSFSLKYFDISGEEVAPIDARSVEVYISLSVETNNTPVNATIKSRTVFRNE